MGIENRDSGVYAQLNDGPDQLLFPLSNQYRKLQSELGFVATKYSDEVLAYALDATEQDFQVLIKLYLTEYLRSNGNNPHPKSEVYQFRGILAHLSQIYYERSMHKRDLGLQDRHLEHVYREYLRTIDEDIRYLNETENETLDNLMLEMGISLPGFRKPTVARDLFNTNTIHILSKIDPNIAQLWKSIEQ